MSTGRIFVAGMLAFGVAAGLALARVPGWRDLPVPALIWPLLAGLLADLAIQALARAGRAQPLTMNERGIGIIGSALIATVIVAVA